MIALIVSVVVIAFCIAMPFIGIHIERKGFNGGICSRCGKELRLFDHDSQGGRGYTCDGCGHKVWVSYFTVDRKFLEKTFKY